MSRLGSNPLMNRKIKTDNSIKPQKEKIIKEYGRLVNMQEELLNNIDFDDLTYINRFSLDDDELIELKDSIQTIGLLNIIYLQEISANENNKNFRIVSGLRRATAIKLLYQEEVKVKGKDRVVIFSKDTPSTLLDSISIDENLKRKNLTILEQSFKFNKEAARKDKSIEEIIKGYNISKKSYYRIKNAINYPLEVREIIEELGADKAELLNKIIHKMKNQDTTSNIVNKYKDLKREELREILKSINKVGKESKANLKVTSRGLTFNFKGKVPKEVELFFKDLKEKIDSNDYSFIK